MENLHLKSTTTVIFDDERYNPETIDEMFDLLNIPKTEEYTEARFSIMRYLIAFRHIDLSSAYGGHNVHVYLKFAEV